MFRSSAYLSYLVQMPKSVCNHELSVDRRVSLVLSCSWSVDSHGHTYMNQLGRVPFLISHLELCTKIIRVTFVVTSELFYFAVVEDEAFVTLATNDTYAVGALVLAHSLRNVGTTRRLAIMISMGVTQGVR